MYQYFIWNGVNSLDMGVVMLKAPSIFIPQRKINEIKVSGRNGVLHEDEKTYQNYIKDAECHVMDRSQIDEVCGWLTGFGEVIFPVSLIRCIVRISKIRLSLAVF